MNHSRGSQIFLWGFIVVVLWSSFPHPVILQIRGPVVYVEYAVFCLFIFIMAALSSLALNITDK